MAVEIINRRLIANPVNWGIIFAMVFSGIVIIDLAWRAIAWHSENSASMKGDTK